ncbi:MAG: Tm-1-like ATP-binding domain-containing protein [Syntrophorhabdales bacterium]|jgi:uncharacterized protein (UPF0261 family)
MNRKGKNIMVAGTLDTKGEEVLYIKELIGRRGHNPLLMDVGINGQVAFLPNFPREEVALATGCSLDEILKTAETYSDALATMATGAKVIIEGLISEGRIDGLLFVGGGLGTTQAALVQHDLPIKLPKLILSTVAFLPGAMNSEMVSLDQAMIQCPSDLWGLNPITRIALQRAAGAICGMAEEQEEMEESHRSSVAISALGVHTYVDRCKVLLSEKGYEAVVFHSIGTGGLEKLVRQGYFSGTLDLSCYELVNRVCGGIAQGSEEKFVPACDKGIPQVISAGGLDFFPLFASQPLTDEIRKRTVLPHGMVNPDKNQSRGTGGGRHPPRRDRQHRHRACGGADTSPGFFETR